MKHGMQSAPVGIPSANSGFSACASGAPLSHRVLHKKPLTRCITGITSRYWGLGLQFYTSGDNLVLLLEEVTEEQMDSIFEAYKTHKMEVPGEASKSLTIFEFMHRLSAGGLSVVQARV